MSRELIQIVEIDQPFCNHTYGESPCTAVLGVTGPEKCHNTYATCQSASNYDPGVKTLRFCNSLENLPRDVNYFPALTAVDCVPTQLNIAGADPSSTPLGRRAKVAIKMRDFPYHDRLVDKYALTRGYDPLTRGTFWTKWIARNPYHVNLPVRVKYGLVGQDPASMQTKSYLLDSISGPSNGEMAIVAKDVLKLTDNDRATAPRPNVGALVGALGVGDTAFNLAPSGAGAAYDLLGWVRIGSELMTYSRSGDSFNIGRGAFDTKPQTANAGALVQQVAHLHGRVDSVMYDLCTVYAAIPAANITFSDWQDEAGRWLSGCIVDAFISEPTGVAQLLGELTQQCSVNIWWDERAAQVRFQAIRPLQNSETVPLLTDKFNILKGSLAQTEKSDQRITEVWYYYNQRNPAQAVDEVSNYGNLKIKIDAAAESANQYDDVRVKQIFCRWFSSANGSEVIKASARILARFRDPPQWVEVLVDAKDNDAWVGNVVAMQHYNIVDFFGNPKIQNYQIIMAEDVSPGHTVKYTMIPFVFAGNLSFIVANGTPVYTLATSAQRKHGCWISQDDGKMTNGDPGYRIS